MTNLHQPLNACVEAITVEKAVHLELIPKPEPVEEARVVATLGDPALVGSAVLIASFGTNRGDVLPAPPPAAMLAMLTNYKSRPHMGAFLGRDQSKPKIRSLEAGSASQAADLNAAVRAEIVELLTCTGRSTLVEAAKTDDLVKVVGMLFTEISDLDAEAQAAPKLRERIAELESHVADTRGPMQAQIERLNALIIQQNAKLEAAGGLLS